MGQSKGLIVVLLAGMSAVLSGPSPDLVKETVAEIARLKEEFLVQSAPARLSLLCLGRFADAGQSKALAELSAQTSRRTAELLEKLTQFIQQMEEYGGQDWEERYGRTNVWSAARQALLEGQYLKTYLLFWTALCDEERKDQILTQVIEECGQPSARWQGQEQILQVLALWRRAAAGDEEQLQMLLHQMMLRDDLSKPAQERMLLLQKRFGLFSGGPFEESLAALFQRKIAAKEDFEWAIEYAFLQEGAGRRQALEQLQQAWPQAREFITALRKEQETEWFNKSVRPALEEKMQTFAARAARTQDPNEREQFEQQWIQWIRSLDKQTPSIAALRKEAAAGYVHYLFTQPDRRNVEKIVQFLQGEVEEGEPILGYLYVQALTLKDSYGQAAAVLSGIPPDCRNSAFDLYVLEGFTERLEEFAASSNKTLEPLVMERAAYLAACAGLSEQDRRRAQLLWAEMAARLPQVSPDLEEKLDRFLQERQASGLEPVIRCRAFRRMQQGRWAEAARDWQTVRSAFEPQNRTEKSRSWHWWRAKYYELFCCAKSADVSREDVKHAVRILQTLYAPPPGIWQERLKALAEEDRRF